MTLRNNLIALQCQISPGVFSGDRSITLTLADGTTYQTLVPRYHLWDSAGVSIPAVVNPVTIEGFVAGRVVEIIDEEQYLVELPDGDCVAIDKSIVLTRPNSANSTVNN